MPNNFKFFSFSVYYKGNNSYKLIIPNEIPANMNKMNKLRIRVFYKIPSSKILLLFLILFFSGYHSLIGQDNNTGFKIPEIIPSSPENYGLGSYGDIPVGFYTGVPDISIPVHVVKIGELSLPITLSYHAGGIRVNQEASWVGLGWNLIAGGGISYAPVGGNDMIVSQPLHDNLLTLLNYVCPGLIPGVRNEDGYVLWNCVPTYDDAKVKSSTVLRILEGAGEPDVYSANFMNYSFKFIKNPRDNTFSFLGKKNKCIIKPMENSNGIMVIGEDGVVYEFECTEWVSVVGGTATQGWFLTKMIHPSGDEIVLKYQHFPILYIPSLTEYKSVCDLLPDENIAQLSRENFSPNYVPLLDTIETKNEWVIFEKDEDRIDLNGGAKLKRIVVKDRLTGIEKRSFYFSYDYFNGEKRGGDYLNDNTQFASIASNFTADNIQKRLKLSTFTQQTKSLENTNEYIFSYNNTIPMPYKTSYAVDHWGYYNGQGNNGTILPTMSALKLDNPQWVDDVPDSFYINSGANKGASNNYITAGMIKSIQYPTGGKTVFEFESHDFLNRKYLSAEDEYQYITASYNMVTQASVIWFTNSSYYNREEQVFTIDDKTLVEFNGFLKKYADFYIMLEGVDVNEDFSTMYFKFDNRTSSSTENIAEWNISFWLPAGSYKLKCYIPSPYLDNGYSPIISGNLVSRTSSNPDLPENLISLGGGVRAKKVTNYDSNGKMTLSKSYSYTNNDSTTSGKLLVPLRYVKYRPVRVGYSDGSYLNTSIVSMSGNSYVPLSSLSYGNNVGYSRVEVKTVAPEGENNGTEILCYSNSEVTLELDKFATFGHTLNGNLISRTLLNASGDSVFVEKNNYSIIQGSNSAEITNVFIEDQYIGPTDLCVDAGGFNPLAYTTRFLIYAYPTENYHGALIKKTTTHYFSGIATFTETENYSYNPNNFEVSLMSTVNNNKKLDKKTLYSTDFGITDLIDKNIVKLPVRIETTVENKLTGGVQYSYNSLGLPVSVYEAHIPVEYSSGFSPESISMPSIYEQNYIMEYDNYNRINELHKVQDIPTSFYWSYNGALPVVKAIGISSDNLKTKTQSLANTFNIDLNNWIQDPHDTKWKSFNTDLRYSLAEAEIYTYTYDPIYGMTSSTAPNGVTTYYEYDDFGRLKNVRNDDGKITSRSFYHYYNETTADGPTLSLNKTSMSFTSSAGSSTFTISSNCTWSVSDNASWLTVSPGSGSGNGTITVTASANSSSARSATITITYSNNKTQSVLVTQAAFIATLTVSPSSLTFPYIYSTSTITISSNTTWTISSSVSWMTLSSGSGSGNKTITVTCSKSSSATTSRSGVLTITGGNKTVTVSVVQSGTQIAL